MDGLRREEIAMAAGVSVDYYTRLEQGRAGNVSDQVLGAVADVMRLNAAERSHLMDLVRPATAVARPVHRRSVLHALLHSLGPVPALLQTTPMDIVAINRMGRALLDDFGAMPRAERNLARWIFLNPKARIVYPDWAEVASTKVAFLRTALGHDPGDTRLRDLVDDLMERSPEFARFWADYRVVYCTYGTKRLHHPDVGTMTLDFESLVPAADPDLHLIIYTGSPGSPSAEKLTELADRLQIGGGYCVPGGTFGGAPGA
ncbi:transcriptional regulator [Acrocarpospora corrugata]|uniref:Transcriptional regulator n=1 Tax=Acrocarpospora corrugata TaxID=35763 RepID=A0A5M3VYE2_9ACTN|nr:transcriptional regulator [Acrocarpospora corrugata]